MPAWTSCFFGFELPGDAGQTVPRMRERRMKQRFARRGFRWGLVAGLLFVAYKAFKYPGSINRRDAMFCIAVVLTFGLAGGLIGMALGTVLDLSDSDR